jgi:hypothetical protein
MNSKASLNSRANSKLALAKRKATTMTKRFRHAYRELLKTGMSENDIQAIFGVGRNMAKHRKNDPGLEIAFQDAMSSLEAQLAGKMIVQAMGYDYVEEKIEYVRKDNVKGAGYNSWKETKKTKTKKHQPGNAQIFMFLMANRFEKNWKISKELVTKEQGYDTEPSKRTRMQIEALARNVLEADTSESDGEHQFQSELARVPD